MNARAGPQQPRPAEPPAVRAFPVDDRRASSQSHLLVQMFLSGEPLDLNPIEQVFAKLKTPLCKTDPRTTEATWRGIGTILDHFKPEECANYLVNAGYASA